MKIKLLTLLFFLSSIVGFSQQTQTVSIIWNFNSIPATDEFGEPNENSEENTAITIEEGDTVQWIWAGTSGHNVKSDTEGFGTPGGQFDTFSAPYTYSYTFNDIGSFDFICAPHEPIMYGTITVVAEGALSLNNVSKADFSIYPNPSVSELNITMNQADSKTNVTVYNILGKQILSQQLTGFTSKINISQWNVGVYLVKVTNDSGTQTKRFVKQ